jgi:hypothetical protein
MMWMVLNAPQGTVSLYNHSRRILARSHDIHPVMDNLGPPTALTETWVIAAWTCIDGVSRPRTPD